MIIILSISFCYCNQNKEMRVYKDNRTCGFESQTLKLLVALIPNTTLSLSGSWC